MRRLLVLAHVPSPRLERLRDALVTAAQDPDFGTIDVTVRPPLEASAGDVLRADALILITPENLGYMSGALKDFFDRCYYDLLDCTDATPYAALIRAGQDGTGTKRAIESICGGLKWKPVQAPVICRGEWQARFLDDAAQLGATMAAGLEAGMF